ncbi:hypothetical protein RFI_02570 [Reticulomyxa filosa]|uniref:Uncharacterized protein n=1 Tax=Reticulomyxa filosa TaxID=46433 RepID=X6P8Y9_RETFI|nr:hypothetical protein RFI_02570 [Reticulomyxa filosa]|eukprot:ETO34524.1 hypothetical protein RFI_02570 [Reticulomyxa filosa]
MSGEIFCHSFCLRSLFKIAIVLIYSIEDFRQQTKKFAFMLALFDVILPFFLLKRKEGSTKNNCLDENKQIKTYVRNTLRSHYQERAKEKDAEMIKKYMKDGEECMKWLKQGVMQLTAAETMETTKKPIKWSFKFIFVIIFYFRQLNIQKLD